MKLATFGHPFPFDHEQLFIQGKMSPTGSRFFRSLYDRTGGGSGPTCRIFALALWLAPAATRSINDAHAAGAMAPASSSPTRLQKYAAIGM